MRVKNQAFGYGFLAVFLAGWIMTPLQTFADNANPIRIKADGAQTEFIMDLAGPAQLMTLDQRNPHQILLQFNGDLLGASPSTQSEALPGHPSLQSVSWRETNGQVKVVINRKSISSLARIYPLSNPDRLVLRVDESPYAAAGISNVNTVSMVAPGVIHRQIIRNTAQGPLKINVLDIDPHRPDISIVPALATESLHGKAKVTEMANRNGAIAGINASYFKPDSGTALGALILNKELISGPLYNRVSLGLGPDHHFRMSRITLAGSLKMPSGQVIPIHNVNQPRLNAEEYILYSPRWGTMAPNTPRGGVEMQIDNNQIVTISTDRQSIPANGYVLVGPNTALLNTLQRSDRIALNVYTTPDWSDMNYAISGGPYLVKDGQVFVDAHAQNFKGSFLKPSPRTAVGLTKNNHLLMVTVDGRQSSVSVGMTLTEMAHLMQDLGAVDAMNFDGGSSTQMVVADHIVNSPTVSGGARVSSALLVKTTQPIAQRIIAPDVIGDSSAQNQ